jgi:methyl-accepting chemotaxis protein
MFRNWTFGRRVAVGFAVAGVILCAVAILGYQRIHHLVESLQRVTHTYEVRNELARLKGLVLDAESGQRGYLVTGDEVFLAPYTAALAEIDKSFAAAKELTADNQEQGRRLDAARPIIDGKLAVLRKAIEQRKSEGFEAAAKTIGVGEGKRFMEELRRVIGGADEQEQQLLLGRQADAEASAALTKAVIVWGSLLGLGLIALVGFSISHALARQIGGAVQHVQSSSAELQAAANQQVTGAKEQSTAIREINTTITELLATSRQIAESAKRVAQIAEQTAAGARQGESTVEKGNETIGGIRRQVDVIVSHMLELGKKSQHIGAVLDIVSELAEQTNILAINATIEAAGAGESGKRFTVVADEIRRLSDRVAGSTKEIRTLIEDVRSAVNTTVMTTEMGSKAVEAGAKQFGDVAAAFKQIAGLVKATTEAAKEIELSTQQQSTAVEQVNVAITDVAQTTKEAEASSSQTLQTASQLAGLSKDLLRLVQPRAMA